VRQLIKDRRNQKADVGAMIIEPISSFNNQMATPYFYRGLRKIASDNSIAFIVDES
jgi:4-aminobutyrate aminotransferase-like enzyme